MMEAVFFDFGGVIECIDHEGIRALENRCRLPDDGLWQVAFETPEWQDLQVGIGTEKEWLEAVTRNLDELAGHPTPPIGPDWVALFSTGLDETVLNLITQLRLRFRVGLISNAVPSLEHDLREVFEIDHLFDVIVNSATVGIAKPDPSIFRHAARSLGLIPSVCVHIDDRMQNVQGAQEAGMHGIHYQGHLPSLVSDLQRLGMEW